MDDELEIVMAGLALSIRRKTFGGPPAMVVIHKLGTNERVYLNPKEAVRLAEAMLFLAGRSNNSTEEVWAYMRKAAEGK